MTILEGGKNLATTLNSIYDQREAANIAGMMMEKVTGFSKSERLIQKEKILNAEQQTQLKNFTNQLLQHKPVQYVLQQACFAGLSFYVDENVLIPRPETEELVEAVIKSSAAKTQQNLTILDVGTGSGCIAITIKKKIPAAIVYALDMSEKALKIAHKNALENQVEIQLFKLNILKVKEQKQLPLFDIIVSNPPYIMQSEKAGMLLNVLEYEPYEALFVPDNDALIFYKAIAGFALRHLKKPGGLFFEINELMGRQVETLLQAKGFLRTTIKKDLQQKDRIVSAFLE